MRMPMREAGSMNTSRCLASARFLPIPESPKAPSRKIFSAMTFGARTMIPGGLSLCGSISLRQPRGHRALPHPNQHSKAGHRRIKDGLRFLEEGLTLRRFIRGTTSCCSPNHKNLCRTPLL